MTHHIPQATFLYGGSDAGHEFARAEWCQLCAAEGAALLQEAADAGKLDLGTCTWGFSEEYYNIPDRLMAGRAKAVYSGSTRGRRRHPSRCRV